MFVPLLWLQLHGAAAADVDGYRRDVYYVVDAYVVKRVQRVDGRREVRWTVFYGERPRTWVYGRARIVSSEWVVVDGTGRLLSTPQFHVLSGHLARPADRRRAGRAVLDGVQLAYDRRDVEQWAEERAATAAQRRGITAAHADALREGVVEQLPEGDWARVRPGALD